MKTNQKGSAVVAIVLAVIVIGVVAYIGLSVTRKGTTTVTKNTTETVATTVKQPIWQNIRSAVNGTYADADVVQVNDTTWRMYYGVQPEVKGNNLEVYSSTSTDGKTWTKDAGVRKTMATFPNVVKLKDGRYRMYFQNAGVIKSAISTDGLTFTDESGVRIDKTNVVGLALDNVAAPTVHLNDDGTFTMIYRGTINQRYAANTPNPTTQVLLWASSSDGLSFVKKDSFLDTRNSTLNGQLDGPNLVKWDDGKLKLFATSYTGVYEFEFTGSAFGEPKLALAGEAKKDAMGFTGMPPGDPSVIKIGSMWFMYFGFVDTAKGTNGIHYATLE